jgi:cytochrome c oxidase subunit 2
MISNYINPIIYTDAPEAGQIYFQDAATPIAEGIIRLHDDVMFYLVLIIIGVSWMTFIILYKFINSTFSHKYLVHGTTIEIIWTITPAFILMAIALPSFKLLYLTDEVIDPAMTVKAIGHQWYWTYEYSDMESINTLFNNEEIITLDSYMIPSEDLKLGQLRLLEVDNPLILPINTHIRILITAADVLHSWAVPSLGIKMDGVPGRLNQVSMYIVRKGNYYGQCSEICGVQHGFMPIHIKAVELTSTIKKE